MASEKVAALEAEVGALKSNIAELEERVEIEHGHRLRAEGEALEFKAGWALARGRPLPAGYLGPGA